MVINLVFLKIENVYPLDNRQKQLKEYISIAKSHLKNREG